MEFKKSNKLTEEDLFNIIKEDTSEVIKSNTDVAKFVSFYNLEIGNNKVLDSLLYKLYRNWSKQPLQKDQFTKELSLFLPSKSKQYKVYLINKNRFNISKELYNFLNKAPIWVSPKTKKHFEAFTSFYNVLSGKVWTDQCLLYYLYDKWTFDNKTKTVLNNKNFIEFMKLYFPFKYVKDNRLVFSLNDIVNNHLTNEQIKEILKGYKEYRAKRR